jgi:hypothetical protein
MQTHGEKELYYGDYNNGVLGIVFKISVYAIYTYTYRRAD